MSKLKKDQYGLDAEDYAYMEYARTHEPRKPLTDAQLAEKREKGKTKAQKEIDALFDGLTTD